jgi:tetratricopeptide (TPR) repeat protein
MTGDRIRWAAFALAAGLGLLWLSLEFAPGTGEPSTSAPGDGAYLAANKSFEDAHYDRAIELYSEALAENANHSPALRGLANAHLQSRQLDDALIAINRAIALEPDFGGNYAIRGIVRDHIGAHTGAVADYEKALALDPGVAQGMGWLDRLLYNVQQPPPTVADRLVYLKSQLALPESERVLRRPEIDAKQRPYAR